MSKPIYLSEENKEQYLREFYDFINSKKLPGGEIQFKRTVPETKEKAKLLFTPKAWHKMHILISEFNTEIGWHGLAKRGDEEKNEYIVYDIYVYPQTVTAATVTTDQKKYTTWLYTQSDENFAAMKFHGHSHVRMGTSPSATDIDHQTGILDQLEDDMFYIFTIWNKQGDSFVKIYDMKKNILFEKKDIEISLTGCEYDRNAFITEAKNMVVPSVPTYGSYNGNGYSGSYQQTPPQSAPTSKPETQNKSSEKPAFNGVKTTDEDKKKSDLAKSDNKQVKKKGTVVPVNSYASGNYDIYDDDDYYNYT